MLDPFGNCTIISIYDGLKCKKSSLLKEYNINKFEDIRELFKNGSSKHSSLQKHYAVQDFLKSIPNYLENPEVCELFKNEFEKIFKKLDNDEGGFHVLIYLLISLYFDIEIILYEKGVILEQLTNVIGINKKNNRNINETLRINFPYNHHVEYMPLENVKKLYNKLREEHLSQEAIYNALHTDLLYLDEDFDDEFYELPNLDEEYYECLNSDDPFYEEQKNLIE